ncbi:MAG: SpoIIE family protein phosphatase [Actinobacteria bacterium]|nr:SpoIIE family protein phosphatase [Actinomycetota bacterium]
MAAKLRSEPYRLWTVVCIVLLAASSALTILLNPEVRLISSLVLPPLIASITTTPRRTAFVIALSLSALTAIAVFALPGFWTTDSLSQVTVIVFGCVLALWISILVERDLRTRRRLALINGARQELDAADGMEDDLISFARAASIDFAQWVLVDIRVGGDEASRVITPSGTTAEPTATTPRATVSATAVAYSERAQREGPLHIPNADVALRDALFDNHASTRGEAIDVLILPVTAGELSATYFLVCVNPHPPWGEAELAQTASLARAAALAARNDQLIDQLIFAEAELRASHDQVGAIIDGIADGVAAQSADGVMTYVNDAAAEMFGFDSAGELVGLSFTEVADRMELRDEDGNPFDPADLPSRRALNGEKNPEAMLRYVVKSTGREWWALVKARAIYDEHGEPLMAISVIEDQTDRRSRELAVRFLADVSSVLNVPGPPVDTAVRLAAACVPDIADWSAVDLAGPDGELSRVADHSGVIERKSGEVQERVFLTGVPELIDAEDLARAPEAVGVGATGAPLRAAIVVPLSARGRPIGTISLALTRSGTRYTEYDLETAIELGRRAGTTLDAAFDLRRREQMLETLQKSLLPTKLPALPGLDVAARFRPAQTDLDVSGDFYDTFAMGDGSFAFVIGDVCGKGPEAAAITALARYTIRAEAMRQSDPAELLRTLNDAMIAQTSADQFCTVAVACVSHRPDGSRCLEVVSAGHPLPILIRESGAIEPIGRSGTLVGVVDEPVIPASSVPFRGGDSLVLYTDGLSAGITTDDVGYVKGMLAGLSAGTAEELAAGVDAEAQSRRQSPSRDDVAILVVRAL